MESILLAIQAVLSVLICIMILLQQRAAGLTAGGSGMNTMYVQRRGAEKAMYNLTIGCSALLVLLTAGQWYIA